MKRKRATRGTAKRPNRRKTAAKPAAKIRKKRVVLPAMTEYQIAMYHSNRFLKIGFFGLLAWWVWRAITMDWALAHPGNESILIQTVIHSYILMSLFLALGMLTWEPVKMMEGGRVALGIVYFAGIAAGISLYW